MRTLFNLILVSCLFAEIGYAGCLEQTPLQTAVLKGDLHRIHRLLTKVDVNEASCSGDTALMTAAAVGSAQIAEILIAHEADIHARNERGDTALTQHTFVDNLPVLKLLLAHGADINSKNENGDTALLILSRDANVEAYAQRVYFLVEQGADLNVMNRDGETVLTHYDANYMKYLISKGAEVNPVGRSASPLLRWSKGGWVYPVQTLVEAGANINFQSPGGGYFIKGTTPLIEASKDDDYDPVLDYLLSKGADVNAVDSSGMTALSYAAYHAYPHAAYMLIKYGSPVDVVDKEGNTPLIIASCTNGKHINAFLIELFVSNGAKVNLRNERGETALGNLVTCMKRRSRDTPGYGQVTYDYLVKHGAVL
jgi:serine/threonine-protein phosphatase 6 regulatory ankyrin repeat subunit A